MVSCPARRVGLIISKRVRTCSHVYACCANALRIIRPATTAPRTRLRYRIPQVSNTKQERRMTAHESCALHAGVMLVRVWRGERGSEAMTNGKEAVGGALRQWPPATAAAPHPMPVCTHLSRAKEDGAGKRPAGRHRSW